MPQIECKYRPRQQRTGNRGCPSRRVSGLDRHQFHYNYIEEQEIQASEQTKEEENPSMCKKIFNLNKKIGISYRGESEGMRH